MGKNFLVPNKKDAKKYVRRIDEALNEYLISNDVGVTERAFYIPHWAGQPVIFVSNRSDRPGETWSGRTSVFCPESEFENVRRNLERLTECSLTPYCPGF